MSNTTITQTNSAPLKVQLPLWKDGHNGGSIQFCGNWKRLQTEEPETFKLIRQTEGFECQDHEYSYKVYKNQYGLSVGRRKMDELMKEEITKQNDKIVIDETKKEDRIVKAIENLIYSVNTMIYATLASTEAERNIVRLRVKEVM